MRDVLGHLDGAANGIRPEVIEAYNRASGDPDTDLPGWLRHGAPVGITSFITSRGIFPSIDEALPANAADTAALQVEEDLWAPAAAVVASLLPPPATGWRHPCGVARLGRRARTPAGSGRGREPASEGSGASTDVLKRPDFGRSPWASTAGDNAVGGRLTRIGPPLYLWVRVPDSLWEFSPARPGSPFATTKG